MFEVEQEHRLTNFGVFEGNTARESGFAISNPPNHAAGLQLFFREFSKIVDQMW